MFVEQFRIIYADVQGSCFDFFPAFFYRCKFVPLISSRGRIWGQVYQNNNKDK